MFPNKKVGSNGDLINNAVIPSGGNSGDQIRTLTPGSNSSMIQTISCDDLEDEEEDDREDRKRKKQKRQRNKYDDNSQNYNNKNDKTNNKKKNNNNNNNNNNGINKWTKNLGGPYPVVAPGTNLSLKLNDIRVYLFKIKLSIKI